MTNRWNGFTATEKEMAEKVFTVLSMRDVLTSASHDEVGEDEATRQFGISDLYAYVAQPGVRRRARLLRGTRARAAAA